MEFCLCFLFVCLFGFFSTYYEQNDPSYTRQTYVTENIRYFTKFTIQLIKGMELSCRFFKPTLKFSHNLSSKPLGYVLINLIIAPPKNISYVKDGNEKKL